MSLFKPNNNDEQNINGSYSFGNNLKKIDEENIEIDGLDGIGAGQKEQRYPVSPEEFVGDCARPYVLYSKDYLGAAAIGWVDENGNEFCIPSVIPPTVVDLMVDAIDGTPVVIDWLTPATMGTNPIDPASFVIKSSNPAFAAGDIVDNADGTLTYTATDGTSLSDPKVFIDYCAEDTDDFASNTATITICVDSRPPVTTPINTVVVECINHQIDLFAATTAGSNPVDWTTLVIKNDTSGLIVNNMDGTVNINVPVDPAEEYTFEYCVGDGTANGISNTSLVTLDVNRKPDPVADGPFQTPNKLPISIDLIGNDTDLDGDALSVCSVDGVPTIADTPVVITDGITATLDSATGNIIFEDPSCSLTQAYQFNYEVTDGLTKSTSTIDVEFLPYTPVVVQPHVDATNENTTILIDLTVGAIPGDGTPDWTTLDIKTGPIADLVDNGDGTVSYTAPSGSGAASPILFTYCVIDTNGVPSNTEMITINVTLAPPVAVNPPNQNASEGIPTTLTVVPQLTPGDWPLDLTTVVEKGGPLAGLTNNGNGTFGYTAPAGTAALSPVCFDFCVQDTQGNASATATACIDVVLIVPPIVTPEAVNVDECQTVVIDLTDNITMGDFPVDFTTVVEKGGPLADLVNNGDGTFDYTPAIGVAAGSPVTFQYCVQDNMGNASAIETVTITVAPVVAPVIAGTPVFVAPETTAPIPGITTTTIDLTPFVTDGDFPTVLATFAEKNGPLAGLVNNGDGTFDYTPPPGTATASVFFDVCVQDNKGNASNVHTVEILAQLPPVAVNDIASFDEGVLGTFDVSLNDVAGGGPIDYTTLTIVGPTPPGLVYNNDGTFDYTPPIGSPAKVMFQYMVTDTVAVASNVADVTLCVNRTPDAVDDGLTVNSDATTNINCLINDTDPDGDTLTIVDINGTTPVVGTPIAIPGGHSITLLADGTKDFTPAPGFTGVIPAFPYTVSDGSLTDTANITITVQPNAPVTVDAPFDVIELVPFVVDITALTTPGTNPVDFSTTIEHGGPTVGLVNNGDGTFTYTAPAGTWVGSPVCFSYCVDDNMGNTSNISKITLNVEQPPVAVEDLNQKVNQGGAPVVFDLDDNDVPGSAALDPASIVITAQPPAGQGTVASNGDGTVTFTPDPAFGPGTTTYSYTIDDVNGLTSNTVTNTVTVNVVPNFDDQTVADGDTLQEVTADVLSTVDLTAFQDAGNLPIDWATLNIKTNSGTGTFVDNGDGTFDYTADAADPNPVVITYCVSDDCGNVSNTATLELEVITCTDVSEFNVVRNDFGQWVLEIDSVATGCAQPTYDFVFTKNGAPLAAQADGRSFTLQANFINIVDSSFMNNSGMLTPTIVAGDVVELTVTASNGDPNCCDVVKTYEFAVPCWNTSPVAELELFDSATNRFVITNGCADFLNQGAGLYPISIIDSGNNTVYTFNTQTDHNGGLCYPLLEGIYTVQTSAGSCELDVQPWDTCETEWFGAYTATNLNPIVVYLPVNEGDFEYTIDGQFFTAADEILVQYNGGTVFNETGLTNAQTRMFNINRGAGDPDFMTVTFFNPTPGTTSDWEVTIGCEASLCPAACTVEEDIFCIQAGENPFNPGQNQLYVVNPDQATLSGAETQARSGCHVYEEVGSFPNSHVLNVSGTYEAGESCSILNQGIASSNNIDGTGMCVNGSPSVGGINLAGDGTGTVTFASAADATAALNMVNSVMTGGGLHIMNVGGKAVTCGSDGPGTAGQVLYMAGWVSQAGNVININVDETAFQYTVPAHPQCNPGGPTITGYNFNTAASAAGNLAAFINSTSSRDWIGQSDVVLDAVATWDYTPGTPTDGDYFGSGLPFASFNSGSGILELTFDYGVNSTTCGTNNNGVRQYTIQFDSADPDWADNFQVFEGAGTGGTNITATVPRKLL